MAPKPAPDVFLELARRLAVEPAAAVVVEDSLPGCLAALDAGMAVMVCPTRATESCAFPVGAHRVGSLAEVSVDGLVALLAARRS